MHESLIRDRAEAHRPGTRRAVDELLTAHLPLVYNVVGRALDGHPDVDDVVQETMERAVAGVAELRDPGSFRPWLIAIAMRRIKERGRSPATRRVTAVPADRDRITEDVRQPPDPARDIVRYGYVRDTGTDAAPVPRDIVS
ncbi:RNA polymerase sigma factor [Streptomyces vilmorinianum]|uniref:RNA polymerase sigma factor n=1 Tax=Streptomyces vilmorinianum TaxID=3051092 RepID=UPI0010FBA3A6